MLFHSPAFLFSFLPAVLFLHRLALSGRSAGAPYPAPARVCLLLATLLFYGWEHPWWLLPFAFSVGFDFLWSALLVRTTGASLRRAICTASVVQNLAILGYFKYWDAAVRAIAAWHPDSAAWLRPHGLELPAGISFYTFESLSFVIDVYRREIQPPRNPLDFFGFMAMFPRFIAGPIVRYRDIAPQLRHYGGMHVSRGLSLFVRGLFLKLCFADSFAFFTGYVQHAPERVGMAAAWLGTFAYAMQIYFDFSGYSLMAIGLGLALGFEFPENFRQPYLATSLQEFWRRWHISLSSWLRDYVYRSLGGSRGGRLVTYRNLLLTMVLGGIWHGAGLQYAAWGLWHGLFLCIERACGWNREPRAWGWPRTLLVVTVGWVFFFSATMAQAITVIAALLGLRQGAEAFGPGAFTSHPLTTALCAGGLLYAFIVEPRLAGGPRDWQLPLSLREQLAATCLLIGALVIGLSQFTIPFLYFQF